MSLSSLIVQREVATIRQVEEALARQVLYGGDLVTNVLEVAEVSERVLVPLLAETVHMPHAPLGPLPAPSPEARSLVPRELAIQRSLLPLDLTEGVLVVVVAEALGSEVLEELSFALGVHVEQRVAPLVRIREALATHYGAPLDRRMARLIGKLAGKEATGLGSLPPLLQSNPHPVFHAQTPSQTPRLRRETPALGSLEDGQHVVHRTNSGFPAPQGALAEDSPAEPELSSGVSSFDSFSSGPPHSVPPAHPDPAPVDPDPSLVHPDPSPLAVVVQASVNVGAERVEPE